MSVFYYDEPLPPSYFEYYNTTVEDEYGNYYYDEQNQDDDYYKPEMEGPKCFCCGQSHTYDDDVCEVFLENPEYWKERMMVACPSAPYHECQPSHLDYYYEPEGVYDYKTEEDKKLATLEVTLSKLDEYLLAPTLSDQDRIKCLTSKCQALAMKIQIEERLSPLPDDIKDCSHMEEEVVEDNTTPMNPLSDEEPLVDRVVSTDGEAKQPLELIVCIEPLPILVISTNKCWEERSRKKVRRVKLQDISVRIMKWVHNNRTCLLNMPIIMMELWRWHVNYRAFIGNAVGKCALRPP